MKRLPKSHNELEYELDNVYQEDERELEIIDDSTEWKVD
ncbi:hypothetical protein SAMN06298210_11354 [Prevotellaceae bacterium KH2P17]|jgi:hypothetical protein|nr:hypothetical protein SAMN06298210_11354 [Prevotellaceae bacterium KH2P17]